MKKKILSIVLALCMVHGADHDADGYRRGVGSDYAD